MKRNEKAAFAVLKNLDVALTSVARANRGNDEERNKIIAAEVDKFERNTGMTVDHLVKAVKRHLNGRRPGKKYRLLHVAWLN